MTPQPTPQVSSYRAFTFSQFLEDSDMTTKEKRAAKEIYNAAMNLPKFGEVSSAELALQLMRYFASNPVERAEMVAKGEALRSHMEWDNYLSRKNKGE